MRSLTQIAPSVVAGPYMPRISHAQIKKRKCVPCQRFFSPTEYFRHIETEGCKAMTKAYYDARQKVTRPSVSDHVSSPPKKKKESSSAGHEKLAPETTTSAEAKPLPPHKAPRKARPIHEPVRCSAPLS